MFARVHFRNHVEAYINLTSRAFFSWQRALYIVNPSSEHTSTTQSTDPIFTTPLNKCHESMAYLTYVIDNYGSLPSTLVSLHSHALASPPPGTQTLPFTQTSTPSNPSDYLSCRREAISIYAVIGTSVASPQIGSISTLRRRYGAPCSQALQTVNSVKGE